MIVRPRTVSQRMLLITVVSLVPALLIGTTAVWTVNSDRVKALHADAFRDAEQTMLEMSQIVAAAENVLITSAAMPLVKTGNAAECSPVLAEVVDDLRFLTALVVMNLDGSVRCSSDPDAGGDGVVRSGLLEAAVSTANRVVGTALDGTGADGTGPDGKPRVLPVARRLDGPDGVPSGVAVAFIDVGWLQMQIAGRSVTGHDSVTVIDRTGLIIARVPEPDRFVGTRVPERVAWLLTAPEPGTVEMESQDGERRVLGYFPPATNASGLYISAGKSISDGLAIARSVAATSTLVGVVGAIVAVLLAVYLTQVFINQPVTNLIRTVSAWRTGDSAARTGMRASGGEICAAGETLDAFMDELEVNRIAKRRAEQDREVLRDELDHRVRNLLATVQAIVRQTFSKAGNEAALAVFSKRLAAIDGANALLKQGSWQSTPLRAVVQAAIAPFAGPDDGRFSIQGPDFIIQGNVVLAFSIALHELCTNAAKYGALRGGAGAVSISWGVTEDAAGEQFFLLWQESGGPLVLVPEHTGFGSKVIKVALASYVGGSVDVQYEPAGLVCKVLAPSANVIASEHDADDLAISV